MTPEERLAYNAQINREQHQAKQVREQQKRDRQIPPLRVMAWDADRNAFRAVANDGTVRYVEPLTNGAIAAGDATRPGINRIDGMPHKKREAIAPVEPENIVAYGAIDTSPTSSTFNYDVVAIYSGWKRFKKVFSLNPDEFVLDIKLVNKKPYVLSRQYIGGSSSDALDHPWHFYSGSKASKQVFNWISPFEGTGGVIGNSKILIYQKTNSSFPNADSIQIKTLGLSFTETGYFSLSGKDGHGATLLLDEVIIEPSLFSSSGFEISLTNLENSFTTILLTEQQGPDNQSLLRFAQDTENEYFALIKRTDPELFRFNAVTRIATNLGPLSDRTTFNLSDTSIYRSATKRQYYLLAQQGDTGVYQFSSDMGSLNRLSDKPFANLAVL